MISVGGAAGGRSGSRSGRRCLGWSGTPESALTLAIRSATVTPSVWLPLGLADSASLASELALRSHGAAPGDGRGVRVSHWLSPSESDGRGSPGVALSPSLMFLPASDSQGIVRVGAHGRMPCLLSFSSTVWLRHWSQVRRDPYRTETS